MPWFIEVFQSRPAVSRFLEKVPDLAVGQRPAGQANGIARFWRVTRVPDGSRDQGQGWDHPALPPLSVDVVYHITIRIQAIPLFTPSVFKMAPGMVFSEFTGATHAEMFEAPTASSATPNEHMVCPISTEGAKEALVSSRRPRGLAMMKTRESSIQQPVARQDGGSRVSQWRPHPLYGSPWEASACDGTVSARYTGRGLKSPSVVPVSVCLTSG